MLTSGPEHNITLTYSKSVLDCGKLPTYGCKDFLILVAGSRRKPNWIPAQNAVLMPGQILRGCIPEKVIDHFGLLPGLVSHIYRSIRGPVMTGRIKQESFTATNTAGTNNLPGSLLESPDILYRDPKVKPDNAAWSMFGKWGSNPSSGFKAEAPSSKKVHKGPIGRLKWAILMVGNPGWSTEQSNTIRESIYRYSVHPSIPHVPGVTVELEEESSEEKLDDAFAKLKIQGVDLVFVVLSSHNSTIHATVKYHSDYSHGTQNRAICGRKAFKLTDFLQVYIRSAFNLAI